MNIKNTTDRRKNKISFSLFITVFISVVFTIIYLYITPTVEDPICSLASESLGMTCVPLASPSIYDKGAIYKQKEGVKPSAYYKFPVDYVLSKSCFSPDANLDFAKFVKSSDKIVNFGKHHFTIDKSLSIGVDLNLPKKIGLKLQAGPKVSDVSSVIMEADSAQLFNLDSQRFIELMSSGYAKLSCVSKVFNSNNMIVNQILVAKNLRYIIENSKGKKLPLHIAIKNQLVEFGGEVGGETISAKDLSTGVDMVFAVNFFDKSLIEKKIKPSDDDLFTYVIEGSSEARVFRDDILVNTDQKQSDSEVNAEFEYHLPDNERGSNENYSPAVGEAHGKWIFKEKSNELIIYSRNTAIPGLRWDDDNATFKTVYAQVKSIMQNEISLLVMNRLNQEKKLSAKITVKLNASLATKIIPPNQSFSTFKIERPDNKIDNIPITWQANLNDLVELKFEELVTLKPGETVKVTLERTLKSKTRRTRSVAIWEDIIIHFY